MDESANCRPGNGLGEETEGLFSVTENNSEEAAAPERTWERIRSYGFSACGWRFVLPQGLYSELLVNLTVTPLPNSPPHFRGLTNLRGNLLPVYRLDGLLQATPATGRVRLALLIENVTRGVALEVDAKPTALDLSQFTRLMPTPDGVPAPFTDFITCVYRSGPDEWWLLDHTRLCARLCAPSEVPPVKVASRGVEQDRTCAQGVGEPTNQGVKHEPSVKS